MARQLQPPAQLGPSGQSPHCRLWRLLGQTARSASCSSLSLSRVKGPTRTVWSRSPAACLRQFLEDLPPVSLKWLSCSATRYSGSCVEPLLHWPGQTLPYRPGATGQGKYLSSADRGKALTAAAPGQTKAASGPGHMKSRLTEFRQFRLLQVAPSRAGAILASPGQLVLVELTLKVFFRHEFQFALLTDS